MEEKEVVLVDSDAEEEEAVILVSTLGEGSENVPLRQQSNWDRLAALLWQQKLVRALLQAQM